MFATHSIQTGAWAAAGPQAGNPGNGERLTDGSDCSSCHAVDRTVVGPAYNEIAKKYAGQQADVADRLARRIRDGGVGNWGDIRMPPHPDLTDARLQEIVQWILSLKDTTPARASSTDVKNYDYKLQDGKTISLDFPLFVEGNDQKVTKDVFRGYTLFNSYCYRCHGTDATESQLGTQPSTDPGYGHDRAAVSGGGHAGTRRQRDAELGRVPERRRDDEHLQVRERAESPTGACGPATVRIRLKENL